MRKDVLWISRLIIFIEGDKITKMRVSMQTDSDCEKNVSETFDQHKTNAIQDLLKSQNNDER